MIYLDNAATTRMSDDVLEAMYPYMTNEFGNPSSSYALGRSAREAVERSRSTIAECIGAEPDEIIFTSGGTEADNMAIYGYTKKHCCPCMTSGIEHKAVQANAHAAYAFSCNFTGIVNIDEIGKAVESYHKDGKRSWLVSIIAVNNETGVRQPIEEIARAVHGVGFVFHTDAVQAFGHTPINVKDMGIDMMSVSAHKINGPKGVGFLYKKKGIEITRSFSGGGQEFGLRPGTENVAGIVGLAEAVKIHSNPAPIKLGWFEDRLISECDAVINGTSCHDNPWKNIINCQLDIHNDTLIQLLSKSDIYISAGSACNSDSVVPSHVLKAMGLTDEQCNRSIRISVGDGITAEEADVFIKEVNRIRKEQTLIELDEM